MREHAIPQDITSYRFHIIGNMTIKQFAEIGAGCLAGFIVYSTNLPIIIKWPVIALFVGLGAMAAFVPIEERPFDHWVVTFFRVLYKPTKFFWTRHSKIPEAFLFVPYDETQTVYAELDLRPARRQRIKEYLTSVTLPHEFNQFDLWELQRLQSIMNTFSTDQTQINGSPSVRGQRPYLKVRVRAIKLPDGDQLLEQPPSDPVVVAQTQPLATLSLLANLNHLASNQVAQEINIPLTPGISIESAAVTQEEAGFQNTISQNLQERAYVDQVPLDQTHIVSPTQNVVTNTNLPFPMPPTEANKLVGMVLSPTNDLLSNTIVEIQTGNGQVARAVKTNALGQFFITTPLDDGVYTILAEHEGYQFSPLQLQLVGDIVPPLEIRSA